MREIITSVVVIASLLGGGTAALKSFHDSVRQTALEKAAQGLPPLTGFAEALTAGPRHPAHNQNHENARRRSKRVHHGAGAASNTIR